MQKPLIFLPFIFVYKLVFAIIKLPYNIIKYFSYGLLYMSQLFVNGVIWSSFFVYSFIKYTINGVLVCMKILHLPVRTIGRKNNIEKSSNDLNLKENKINNQDELIISEEKAINNEIIPEISSSDDITNIDSIEPDSISETKDISQVKKLDINIPEKLDENKIEETIINPNEAEIENVEQNNIEENKVEEIVVNTNELETEDIEQNVIINDITDLNNEIENKIKNINYDELVITEKELNNLTKQKLAVQKKIKLDKERQKKEEISAEKNRAREEARKLKAERKNNLDKKSNDVYVNEKVKIEKPGIGAILKDFNKKLSSIPKKISNKFKNNDFAKHRRNQNLMKREALLINFEGEDAQKSDVKIPYQYEAKDANGKYVKDYFEAFSKVEVHSYLLSEGYEVYSIKTDKWIQFLYSRSSVNHVRIKTKDLIFFLTQLSTYLKAGIPLVEALKILAKQFKQKKYKKIFNEVVYDLTTGQNFSEALLKQNVAFPRLLINMVKTAEMTGELPEVLDDMADYYTQTEKTRKQMITALMYPSLVLIFAIGVITFIMLFVIPQFVQIYETMDASQIPGFTIAVIAVSDFIKEYIVELLIGIVVVILIILWLFKNVKIFRTITQWILMHIPVIGTTIIYNEVTMFTKTFSSLLSHNVFITDSMEVLNKITNNEIYKMLILDTIANLAKGDKISTAFEGHWAFPVPAYEMLVTGEKTGELAEMMGKVADYYQTLHTEQVARIKTFIEPILTVFLTVVVGIIILAVIIPMFNMYQTIQSY